MILNSCNNKKISIDISLNDINCNNNTISYTFVSSVATAELSSGMFSTNDGSTSPTSITSLIVNLQDSDGNDLTETLTFIGDQKSTLCIVDESNSNNSLEFKVDAYQIVNNHIVYTVDTQETIGLHNLVDNNSYSIQFNSTLSVTRTSELINDGNGTSAFATLADLSNVDGGQSISNVSDLNNDGNGTSPFATLADLSNVDSGQNISNVSDLNNDGDGVSPFATLADLSNVDSGQNISNVSELSNDGDGVSPFSTQAYVLSLINSINNHYGPYTSTANALAAIPSTSRTIGLTVLIYDATNNIQEEYWFRGGISDANLVSKCCTNETTDNGGDNNTTPTGNTTVYYGQSASVPTDLNIKSFLSSSLSESGSINAPFDSQAVHFFTIPSGLTLTSAVNSAILSDVFYSSTSNSYTTTTISIDGENHTLYYFQALAPLGQDVIISFNLI